VLINVTSFFRDAEAWDVLKTQVVPLLITRAEPDRPIRIWSVGCASGQEPFSIAMLLAEPLGPVEFCQRVKIYATDLDEDALKAARAATYSPRDVEDVPAGYLEKHFAGMESRELTGATGEIQRLLDDNEQLRTSLESSLDENSRLA
jgi:two-component system CheB/CheR fusion protein